HTCHDGASGQSGSNNGSNEVQGQTGSDGGNAATQPGWDTGGNSATSQPGSDAGSSTSWSQPAANGSDTSSSPANSGADSGAATIPPVGNPGSDSGAGTGTGTSTTPGAPPLETAPVAGAQGTPTDAASALAGFQMPNLSGNVIEPQFGNGKSDTQAIQDAVNQAAATGGGVVHIPAGTYNIDAANDGIVMKSNVSLVMDKGTTLQAIPTGAESGCIIDVRNANNVNIYGGKLVGDFGPGASHSGETMSGIDVLGSSSNIDIQGVESDANKGDGFDISGNGDNIHIAHCVAQGNKRDGLSIEGGSQIVIENNAFINTGTADSYDNEVPSASRLPNSGIDIENSPGQSVNGAIVRNNLLAGNGTPSIDANTSNGWGIRVTGSDGNNSQVIDNTVVGNAAGGIGVWSGAGNIISGNVIENQPNPYSIFGGSASGDGNTADGDPVGPTQG
ncbi:MAG TPA: right-handed parallel beta-helix repeat-containing protein, partial [Chroococcales cyanobacterium]